MGELRLALPLDAIPIGVLPRRKGQYRRTLKLDEWVPVADGKLTVPANCDLEKRANAGKHYPNAGRRAANGKAGCLLTQSPGQQG